MEHFGAVPVVSLQMIRDSIMRARLAANSERKIESAKRIDYYRGDQEQHLERVLAKQFKHPERLRLQLSFSNIVRRIINEVSVVYKKSPQRFLTLNGKRLEGKGADSFSKMYEKARADAVLKKANRYTNLLNTLGVQAVWRDGCVQLDILTPDILNVVQNAVDPTQASAVIIEQGYADTVTLEGPANPFGAASLFISWTADAHMVFDEQGRPRPELGNKEGKNPYGLIPIVFFRDAYPDSYFWNEGSFDLINAQETLNVFLTELNQLVKFQSFSVPVIIGDAPPEGVTVDPSNFISIPLGDTAVSKGQPDFKFVSPSPKINEIIEVIRECVRRIADDYGLSMDSFKLSGSPASGLSLKLSNIRLVERREDDIALYMDYERELFKVMRAVHNAHCETVDEIPEKAEFGINFAELEFPEDPAAEDARWITHIGQNLKTREQWLMSIDPDIKTEADATAKIKGNMDLNAASRSALPGDDPASLVDTLTGKKKGPDGEPLTDDDEDEKDEKKGGGPK